jgi:hypothetical protein
MLCVKRWGVIKQHQHYEVCFKDNTLHAHRTIFIGFCMVIEDMHCLEFVIKLLDQ